MNTYTFFWKCGISEVAKGSSLEDALDRAGYTPNALRLMEFHGIGDKKSKYYWTGQSWIPTRIRALTAEL